MKRKIRIILYESNVEEATVFMTHSNGSMIIKKNDAWLCGNSEMFWNKSEFSNECTPFSIKLKEGIEETQEIRDAILASREFWIETISNRFTFTIKLKSKNRILLFFKKLLNCYILKNHNWISKTTEGIKPDIKNDFSKEAFYKYARMYCKDCGNESKLNKRF